MEHKSISDNNKFKHCQQENCTTVNKDVKKNSSTLNDIHQKVVRALQIDLDKANLELKQKTLECAKLQSVNSRVEGEIEDLTTSLFEEANKMVYNANLDKQKMEKKLVAAEGKIEALQTEVDALKALVVTSTPSNPNRQSHPQLIKKSKGSPIRNKMKRNNAMDKANSGEKSQCSSGSHKQKTTACIEDKSFWPGVNLSKEVDHTLMDELREWYKLIPSGQSDDPFETFCNCSFSNLKVSKHYLALEECVTLLQTPFMRRIFLEDISLCLKFPNVELAKKVSAYIHRNSIIVEFASGIDNTRKCALSRVITSCKHRIHFDDSDDWFAISQSCRNRVITVCDFLTYIRYIKRGIVKHDVEQIYWEIIKLRLEMTLARLGYFREQS
ncbi:unnamed protein product [Clavelina lepadiformis]|uniref:GDP/GTP exchange factor Sec2 N-terminal domain-containing protein n=1 Tax=Clavelina lepadiformis TaxID=159417 RepID=A0ABP0FVI2_CLALP